jgi:riboflavin-specific deaminase-like protein
VKRARPRCFLNVAISLDGKIASAARENPDFPSPADRRRMDEIRARADAILVGAGTLRASDHPLTVRSPRLRRARLAAGRPEQPLNILLSAGLRIPLRGRFFRAPGVRRLVVTCGAAPRSRLREVQGRALVWEIGRERVDLGLLLRILRGLGYRELLLEGGGRTNFAFFERGWVDEVFLTVCPVIIGGENSPTPVDGAGFRPGAFRKYRLRSVRRTGSEIFLHYIRTRS